MEAPTHNIYTYKDGVLVGAKHSTYGPATEAEIAKVCKDQETNYAVLGRGSINVGYDVINKPKSING